MRITRADSVVGCRGVADSEQGALKRVLRDRFRYNAAVSLQWVLFGSSGHKEPPPNGQLDGFRKCTGDLSKQMKCIGNTYWLNHIRTFAKDMVHQCSFRCAPAGPLLGSLRHSATQHGSVAAPLVPRGWSRRRRGVVRRGPCRAKHAR